MRQEKLLGYGRIWSDLVECMLGGGWTGIMEHWMGGLLDFWMDGKTGERVTESRQGCCALFLITVFIFGAVEFTFWLPN